MKPSAPTHTQRIESATGGLDRSGRTPRFARRGSVVIALGLAAAVLVGCSPDRPAGVETQTVQIPRTPVGDQLRWVMSQLNGEADTLTQAEVETHFAPVFLETFPSPVLIDLFRQTSDQAGDLSLTGFSRPLGPTEAIALILAQRPVDGTQRAAVYIDVEQVGDHRITYLALSDAPGASARELSTPGPYTGAFEVGDGRSLFLSCAGSESPTVILEAGAGGGANSWTLVQPEIATVVRVCSYDRA